jgi:hypothetical protein
MSDSGTVDGGSEPEWSDEALDQARRRCDPLADDVITALENRRAGGGANLHNDVLAALYRVRGNDEPWPAELPQEVRDYGARVQLPPDLDQGRIAIAQELFATFGSEMLLVLGMYALPAAFAAAKGAKAVHATADLVKHPLRRLWETCQFVVDVLEPGGLEPGGRGVQAARMVRLFHANVRLRIRSGHPAGDGRPFEPWDAARLGEPINQEDLAGTLTEFGFIVLDGLRRLDIDLEPHEKDAYVYLWSVVGGLLGVDDGLRAGTFDRARTLAGRISERQLAPSWEGQDLTAKLLGAFASKVWLPFRSLPRTFLRHFLARDVFRGRDVAKMLGVTSSGWTVVLLPIVQKMSRWHDDLTQRLGTSSWLVRRLSTEFLQLFLSTARTSDRRAKFYVSDELHTAWHTKARQKQRKRSGGKKPAASG